MTDLTAQNTFCPSVYKGDDQPVSVSCAGTWVGTVTVQRSRDGNTWRDVEGFTANFERDSRSAGGWYWRAGFKTGGYTSGTASVDVY